MEHLILGLLILSPMTGYELQLFIKQNLSLICSHSAGSIQAAVRSLMRKGQIAATETAAGKRRKKTFSITESGRAAFDAWVAQPMQADKVKNMELSRLFFLGLAKPEDRTAAIQQYIRQMEEIETVLCAIRTRFQQTQGAPLPPGNDWVAILRFQAYTIEYGIAAARFERDWYRHLLCELEETS